jgi:hypothetical protein
MASLGKYCCLDCNAYNCCKVVGTIVIVVRCAYALEQSTETLMTASRQLTVKVNDTAC